ncbi:MAG TPA: GntR family transcriptional regulator [Pirellulales bacterium]|nr:GntR family transcriptional regulator [Pirellulales bacterium]
MNRAETSLARRLDRMNGNGSGRIATPRAIALPPVRTVREQVTDRLRQAILSGQFETGQRLKETELASELGVSRGPIRDALLQLTSEGVLEYQPNCGVEVAPPADDAVRSVLVSLRRTIESSALRLAYPKLSPPDVAAWEAILEKLRAACEAEDFPLIVESDMAFHRWVVEHAREPDLLSMWLRIVMRLRLVYSRHKRFKEIIPEHARVVKAVRRGDLEAAVKALEANIR